ncbi:Regulatory protein AfsR [Actinosynnema sp. ALI-1.44]
MVVPDHSADRVTSVGATVTGDLVQAGVVHGGLHVHHPPTPVGPFVPRQLPAPPPMFAGRAHALAELDLALDPSAVPLPRGPTGRAAVTAISTIGGAGGIGKTWLALHWASRRLDLFPDGQLFVDLQGFSPTGRPVEPDVAVRGFLDALGVEPGRVPAQLGAQAAMFRSLVAGRRMLVVLDNAASSDQVEPLLPGSPTCAVLITCRTKLASLIDRYGARHLQLDVLSGDEAHALMAGRLGRTRMTAEPATADDLVKLCGHYPLALSIMARHAHTRPTVPLQEFTAELRELGLEMLEHDTDPAASLPTVLSWSLSGLTATQRQAFALLGVAPGPDTGLPAAASLIGLPMPAARKVLRVLEDASLIDRRARGRFTMHDLIRGYAAALAQRLAEPVRRAALERVVDFYLHTACAADRLLEPHAQPLEPAEAAAGTQHHPLADDPAALSWLDTEYPHLLACRRIAAAQRRPEVVWQLAWALTAFHGRRGHRADAVVVWRAALEAARHLPHPARSRAHRLLGRAYARLDRHDDATDHLREALTLAVRFEDVTEQAHAHHMLAWSRARQGDDRRALRHARRALHLYRTLDQRAWEANALNQVGWLAARLGDYDTAREACRAALAFNRRHGNTDGEAATLDSLGYIDLRTGSPDRAVELYQQALRLFDTLGDTAASANTLDNLGHAHAAAGRPDRARTAWRAALDRFEEHGRASDATRVRRSLEQLAGGEAVAGVR